jgi:hypothetical protein
MIIENKLLNIYIETKVITMRFLFNSGIYHVYIMNRKFKQWSTIPSIPALAVLLHGVQFVIWIWVREWLWFNTEWVIISTISWQDQATSVTFYISS